MNGLGFLPKALLRHHDFVPVFLFLLLPLGIGPTQKVSHPSSALIERIETLADGISDSESPKKKIGQGQRHFLLDSTTNIGRSKRVVRAQPIRPGGI